MFNDPLTGGAEPGVWPLCS